jgi:hypothetical protein
LFGCGRIVPAEILVVVGRRAQRRGRVRKEWRGRTEGGRAEAGLAVEVGGALQEDGERAVLVLLPIGARPDADVAGRLEQQRHIGRAGRLRTDLAAGELVPILAAIFEVAAAGAKAEDFRDDLPRHRQGGFDFLPLRQPGAAADRKLLGRILGDVIDRAGIGIAPVERRLRTLDDLDPLDRLRIEALDVALIIDAVDEEGGTGLDARLHAGEHVGLAADDGRSWSGRTLRELRPVACRAKSSIELRPSR